MTDQKFNMELRIEKLTDMEREALREPIELELWLQSEEVKELCLLLEEISLL